MNIEAWPFLISRNKVFDYRTVMAPPFMIDRTVSSLLAKATTGDLTEENYAIYREIHGSPVGDICLIFRIMRANLLHLGLKKNEILKDGSGRPIYLIEGLTVKGSVPDILITQSDFTFAHKQMEDEYRIFWDETIRTPPVRPSKALILQCDSNADDILELQTLTPLVISPATPTESEKPDTFSSSAKDTSLLQNPEKQLVDEGDILWAEKRYDAAFDAYNRALRINPYNAPAHVGIGDVFYRRGDYEKANQAFKQALEYDQRNALAYNGLGNILNNQSRKKEALEHYEKALQIDPDCAFAYFNKGSTLESLGLNEESRQAYELALLALERIIHKEPNNPVPYFNKSTILKLMGRSREAKEAENEARNLKHEKK